MRVLITGVSGKAGLALARTLARAEGITAVHGLCRNEARMEATRQALDLGSSAAPVNLLHGDLREPLDGLSLEVDAVIHAAALRGPRECEANPREALLVNVLGTRHVVDYARRIGARTFLFYSIQSAYDRACPVPIAEEAPTSGDELYQITKLAAEAVVRTGLPASMQVQILRLSHFCGIEAEWGADGILGAFQKEVPAGRIRIDGSGAQTVCFLHIQDLCDLTLHLLCHPTPSGTYNLCSETLLVAELARLFREASLRHFSAAPELSHPHPDLRPPSFGLDLAKLQRATGWAPRRRMEEVVDALVAQRRP